MKHRRFQRAAALLLGLTLLSSQCACSMIPPELLYIFMPQETDSSTESASELPETRKTRLSNQDIVPDTSAGLSSAHTASTPSETTDGDSQQRVPSAEGQQSLAQLRDRIDFPQTMFGAAYLGYLETPYAAGSSQWLCDLNAAMVLKYPFLAEIDADHIIGSAGHLYCIVPVDPYASLAINRIRWNEQTWSEEITEVAYRSETGEPVLLFANLDGVAYEDDTLIHVTDNSGNTCAWYPGFDAMSHLVSCTSKNGDNLCFDFTEYGWQNADPSLAPWLADDYGGPLAITLGGDPNASPAGLGWVIRTGENDPVPNTDFSLWLYSHSETGGSFILTGSRKRADGLGWEEVGTWNGTWSIQTVMDGPTDIIFDLSLITDPLDYTGPMNYPYDTTNVHLPREVDDIYSVLISPSGTELVIGPGVRGSRLPFMSWDNSPCVLTLAE